MKLAVFGCSWAVGAGVSATNNWASKLSSMLEIEQLHNLGIEGSSNSRSVLQLIDYVETHGLLLANSIAIFSITSQSRDCLIRGQTKTGLDIVPLISSSEPSELIDYWQRHFTGWHNEKFGLHKNLLSMQAICARYNIHDFYIPAWLPIDDAMLAVDYTKIYSETCVTALGYANYTDYHSKRIHSLQCGHPNELGHSEIAKVLYNWILGSSRLSTQPTITSHRIQ